MAKQPSKRNRDVEGAPGTPQGRAAAGPLIQDFGRKIVYDIYAQKPPKFRTVARTRSNVIYDEKKGFLTLGGAMEERNFINMSQTKRFMQSVAIAAKCNKFIRENLHTSIRGLFYQLKFSLGEDVDENVFSEQSESNPLIEDLEASLGVRREDLNLNANRKGVLAGNMKVIDKFGGEEIETDTSKMGRSGWAIPSDVDNEIEFVDVKADYVLCLPAFEKVISIVDGEPRVTTIEKLVETFKRGTEVLSFDQNLSVNKNMIESVHKRDARPGEKVFRITSKSGSVITVSEDHKVPIIRDGELKVVRAKELNTEDFVLEAKHIKCLDISKMKELDVVSAISRTGSANRAMVAGASALIGNPRETAKTLNLKIVKKFGKKRYAYPYTYLVSGWKERDSMPLEHYLRLDPNGLLKKRISIFFKGSKRADLIPSTIPIGKDFCKLIGYYLADGHTYKNTVGFSFNITENDYRADVEGIVKRLFGLETSKYDHRGETQVFINSRAVAEVFRSLDMGVDAHTKRLPSFAYNLNPDLIRALLEGYLNGDGYKNTFSTVSDELQTGVNLLLKIIGVPAYKSIRDNSRGFPGSSIINHTAFIARYLDGTPPTGTPHYLWERYPVAMLSAESHNPVFEPYFANSYRTITQNRVEQSEDESVKRWLSSDIHPVMIRKIEALDYSGPLYDIVSAVPNHVFMHASGIFSHNCVEKDAVWQRLNEDGFWKKENCILISPQGQAARGTRRLIRKLADKGLPVYVFNDGDAWGWYIYWTIKTGSMNLAYIGGDIATPEARFLGVTMSDIEKYDFLKKMTLKASEVDLKRAHEMLQYPWINQHKEWVTELKKVLSTKTKIEQDTLQGPRLTFVGDYVREKISTKDYLP